MHSHRTLALIAILFVTLITTISAEDPTSSVKTRRKRFTCPDESVISNCTCQEFGTQFMFHCPPTNPTLEVKMNAAIQAVQLSCQKQYDQYGLDDLPNLETGNIRLLVVKTCVLNETQPILETFGFLGVVNVEALAYDDFRDLQKMPYSRQQFEGLETLQNLTLTRGVGIQSNTLEGLSNLKRLNIQFNKLQLQRGMFDGLRSLEDLSLEYNQIVHLEEGLFKNQGYLKKLSLARNNITNISKEVFSGLNSLRVLDVRNNNIASLDSDVLTLLPDLIELNIGGNPISRFPEGLLSGNRKLRTFGLRINKNTLDSLPEDFLANLPQLNKVDLDFSKISHLPETLLRQSTEIVELNLSHNLLKCLPEILMRDQHQLQKLNLAHNLLETIPDELLVHNRKLTTLQLSNNRLQSLSENVFGYLKNLKELHLENNILHTIDVFTFSANRALEELYLQNNRLAFHATSFVHDELNIGESDNTPFQYLGKLRTLKLQNNSISAIFIDWTINNLQLQELDLRNNRISELEYGNLQFHSNISVNLSNNNISLIYLELDKIELKKNPKIVVDLSNNPLDCNCNVLGFVKYVQDESTQGLQFNTDRLRCTEPINLRDTPMTDINTEDLKCPLILGCPAKCSCDLRPVDSTIVVNCNGLGLTQVPELPQPALFEGFNSIELHLDDNLLTKLPTSNLTGYDQVTQLHVRNNSIRHLLSENIPPKLKLVDLSQNQLQTIEDSTVEFLNRTNTLSGIRLSGNRWSCNCDAARLLNFVQRNQHRIVDMPEVRCDDARGQPLGSITVNDLCNEELTTLIVICVTVAVMGLTVGLLSTLFYRYQIEVKVWLFTHNLFLWLITEDELDRDKRFDAFISYSYLDEEFIADQLVPTLEQEPMNFKTCWHVRDFMPGETILEQITKFIANSRRTVIVLSKNFLQSNWAKEEFRQAHFQSMEDHRVRVIVVIYDDIGDVEKLDPELKAYLKTNTYVKWGDPWFWDKLRYAMPHPLKIKGLKRVETGVLLEQVDATAPKIV